MSFGKVTVLLSVLVAGLVWQTKVLSSPSRSDEDNLHCSQVLLGDKLEHPSSYCRRERIAPTFLACRFQCRRRCVRPGYPCYPAPTAMPRAEEKVELRWKFDVGKPFFEVITTH